MNRPKDWCVWRVRDRIGRNLGLRGRVVAICPSRGVAQSRAAGLAALPGAAAYVVLRNGRRP